MDIFATLNTTHFGDKTDYTVENCLKHGINCFRVNVGKSGTPWTMDAVIEEAIRVRRKYDIKVMMDIPYPRKKPRIYLGKDFNYSEIRLGKDDKIIVWHCESDGLYTDCDDMRLLQPGDKVYTFDGETAWIVTAQGNHQTELIATEESVISNTKAIYFNSLVSTTNLLDKMLEYSNALKPEYVALSFACKQTDIIRFRQGLSHSTKLIGKIESADALEELNSISQECDLMVARGDLFVYSDFQKLPENQQKIVDAAKAYGRGVYIATGILDTLSKRKLPSQADLCDLYNIMKLNPDGIVLSYGVISRNIKCATEIINNYKM